MATSFIRNVNYKNSAERATEEYIFDGGLNADTHETKLKTNESPNMENVVFPETKNIKTRNGYRRLSTDPIGASSDEANTGASTGTVTLDAVGDYAAQTFQVGTQADIVQVDFYMAMSSSGQEQLMQAQLWTGSTGPSAFISNAQILLVSGTSETKYSFRFRVPYTLAATTEYAVVLKPYVRGTTQAVNSVLVHRTGDAYASGGAYTSIDSGLSWSAVSSVDLKFNVFTGATAGTGLIRFYTDTSIKQSFAKVGTSLYRIDDSTGVATTITLPSGVTLNTSNFIDWTTSNNTLLVVDKENRIKKYRGSTNSNYSTGTITVTNASATITGSGTSWATTTNAEVGEYIQLPDSKWYKITAIASNTSLTIELAYQGSTLAGQNYVISPWGEVQGKLNSSTAVTGLIRPTPDFIENHINRIWTLDGNTLRFSVLDTSVTEENFNDWDTANNAGTILIPSGDGDIGTGLYSLGNSLYIFQRRAIWRLYGNSPANFELRNVSNEIGMIDKRTLVEYDDILMFLSDEGIYMFDGSSFKNVSENKVNTLIASWANKTSPTATLWDNKYLISYTPSGGSSNSEALYLDIKSLNWGKFTGLYVNYWSQWNGGNDDGRIYFISSNQGSVYRWDIGGNDDGYTISTLYDTPSLGSSSGISDKNVKKFYIQQLALGDWNMTVTQLDNISETETVGSTINLSSGTDALWDVAQYDEDSFSSDGAIITTRINEFQGMAKYFKYRMQQEGYDEGIEVIGLLTTTRVRRLR